LQAVLALLVVTPLLAEVLAVAERLDLRDLSEYEISWLEGVSVRTVRDWRLRGAGPNYRDGGGIRYPLNPIHGRPERTDGWVGTAGEGTCQEPP
jgi:hypothetical protein